MVGTTPFITAAGSASIAVASTAVVYTKAICIKLMKYFAIKYKATSVSGAPDVKIELEFSDQAPTTEGAADTNFVAHKGASALEANLTAETFQIASLTLPVSMYMRLKITGNAGNTADAIVTATLLHDDDM